MSPATAGRKRTGRARNALLGAVGVLVAFAACEALGRSGMVRSTFLPPPPRCWYGPSNSAATPPS
ncbi:hypothetical protein ACFQ10_03790 [Streptomyces indonesiensis]